MNRTSRRASRRDVVQPEAATTESSAPEIQLASALDATNRAPADPDTIDVGARNASLAAGDNDQRFYIYAYGEQAGNHTISDLSAGAKVFIWVEEGSSEEYTYTPQGADTLVSIGQSSILLKNVSPDNLHDFVFVEQNFVFTIDPIEEAVLNLPSEPTGNSDVSASDTVVAPPSVEGGDPTEENGTLQAAPGDDPVDVDAEPPGFVSFHIFGQAESELLIGDTTNLSVFAGGGDDTVVAGTSDVMLAGEDGNDLLLAHSGRSTLFGDGGNDFLIGSSGDDDIEGGSGNNYLIGGSGSDEFVYWGPLDFAFSDTIADFDAGDRISIFPQNEPIEVSFELQDSGTLIKVGQSSVLLETFFAENVRDFVTVYDDRWFRIDRIELTPSGGILS